MESLLLAFVVFLIAAYFLYQSTSPIKKTYYEPYTEPAPPVPKQSYLDVLGDALFTERDKSSHQDYVEKRYLYGDHTLRLDAIPSPTNTNFIGLRKPRAQVSDPYAAQQLGIEYNNSEAAYIRLT